MSPIRAADPVAYLDRCDLAAVYGPSHERQALEERLDQTRADGYAVNPGLIVEGSWGMGAAVFDAAGAPIAALSLTGVEHRFKPERRRTLGRLLLRAAHHASEVMLSRSTTPP